MSENTWRKRETVRLECPSGNICYARRPGPETGLRGGKIASIFDPSMDEKAAQEAINELDDDQLHKVYDFAREFVLAAVVNPKLSRQGGDDLITPEDIPSRDFWFIFRWAIRGGRDIPVKLEEGETTVDTVENFPLEQGAHAMVNSNGEQAAQVSG